MISNEFVVFFCLAESWLSPSNAFNTMKLLLCFTLVYIVFSLKSFKSMQGIHYVNTLLSLFFYPFIITCMLSSSIISVKTHLSDLKKNCVPIFSVLFFFLWKIIITILICKKFLFKACLYVKEINFKKIAIL